MAWNNIFIKQRKGYKEKLASWAQSIALLKMDINSISPTTKRTEQTKLKEIHETILTFSSQLIFLAKKNSRSQDLCSFSDRW